MINPDDLSSIEKAYEYAKKHGDFTGFETLLKREREYTDKEYVCDITWSICDIEQLSRDYEFGWDDEKILDVAHGLATGLQDRSIEEGWQILYHLCYQCQQEPKEKKMNKDDEFLCEFYENSTEAGAGVAICLLSAIFVLMVIAHSI